MANPQLENGHVEIATEIMEKLCSYRIPGEQRLVFDAIMRKTWGWHKKADAISLSQFMELTRLGKTNIIRSLRALKEHGVINHDNGIYSIQKDHDRWLPYEYRQGGKHRVISHDNAIINHDNVINHDNDLIVEQQNVINHDNGQPLSATITNVINHDNEIINHDNKSLSTTPPTKDTIKDTITKDNKDNISVFDFWNSKNIIVHRRLTDDIKRAISSKLRDYGSEDVCKAISNYAEIVFGQEYWWKHRWTLKDFLQRGFEKFLDGEVARQNYRNRQQIDSLNRSYRGTVPKVYKDAEEYL